MAATTDTARRVYVADLNAYNSGTLHGVWLDVSDPDTMHEQAQAMIAASPVAGGEEYLIHDHDGEWHGYAPGETADFAGVCGVSDLLDEHGPAFAAYCDNLGLALSDDAFVDFETAYGGEWGSEAAFAENLLDDLGELKNDSLASRYFDYDAFTRDLFMSDYFSCPAPGGGVFVYRNT
jgi:antirestriction protein